MIVLFCTSMRLDRILCSPLVFVLGFQTNPKESHLAAVKRILRYLKGTPELGLWYPKILIQIMVVVNWIGKTLLNHVSFLVINFLVGLRKAKLRLPSTGPSRICGRRKLLFASGFWVKTQLLDYGYKIEESPYLLPKTLDIRVFILFKDNVEKGNIEMFFSNRLPTCDLFTKPLDEKCFNFLVSKLGMKLIHGMCELNRNFYGFPEPAILPKKFSLRNE
ncbi:hypothetical protein OSB04_un000616 [Centaurea solstitialis]|uniref:Uncharacterized protein n=1 Tax=Centaurea solstitialis TaxID=347529 RepID=A0AA38VVC4_9ASTR|nr:hypothetical protein OSB04_un000616 [Centaurea solstitialis]